MHNSRPYVFLARPVLDSLRRGDLDKFISSRSMLHLHCQPHEPRRGFRSKAREAPEPAAWLKRPCKSFTNSVKMSLFRSRLPMSLCACSPHSTQAVAPPPAVIPSIPLLINDVRATVAGIGIAVRSQDFPSEPRGKRPARRQTAPTLPTRGS